jgi:hypothetical protein
MADLVQMECLRGLTRAVRVTSGRQTGVLFFDQGQLVHAELGGLSGERAAVAMLGWDAGTFQPVQRYFTDPPTIQSGWQGLLLRSAAERDEAARGDLLSSGMLLDESQEPAPETEASGVTDVKTTTKVRFDESGQLIESHGDAAGLLETAAYVLQLAGLVGEALGMPEVRAVECERSSSTLLCCRTADGHVALETKEEGDLLELRREAGLA